MKIAFHHDGVYTVAYELLELKDMSPLETGTFITFKLGISIRHPKDSPNRKIGNAVAEGRLDIKNFEILDLCDTHEGVQLLAISGNLALSFFKYHKNKNFYLMSTSLC